jgi:hypothetical protein
MRTKANYSFHILNPKYSFHILNPKYSFHILNPTYSFHILNGCTFDFFVMFDYSFYLKC